MWEEPEGYPHLLHQLQPHCSMEDLQSWAQNLMQGLISSLESKLAHLEGHREDGQGFSW